MKLPTSRAARFGLALLPWLPLAILIAVVWSYFPATDRVTVETMRLDQPSIYYSEWEQTEQAWPGFHLFLRFLEFSIVAFIVGFVLLAVAFFRRRRDYPDATPTI